MCYVTVIKSSLLNLYCGFLGHDTLQSGGWEPISWKEVLSSISGYSPTRLCRFICIFITGKTSCTACLIKLMSEFLGNLSLG
jgi:hypothetical protein